MFVEVGFRYLRPSFIHGFYVGTSDFREEGRKTEIQVYYDGNWIPTYYCKDRHQAWEYVRQIEEMLSNETRRHQD